MEVRDGKDGEKKGRKVRKNGRGVERREGQEWLRSPDIETW
jgi:hypothetical protein